MTTAEMLATFRFRMEDPTGEKWDSSSLTEIYKIFSDAQRIAIRTLADAGKFQYLQELQEAFGDSLSGGSIALPSDFFIPISLLDPYNRWVKLFNFPPDKLDKDTVFLSNDKANSYGYIFGNRLYLHGFDSTVAVYICNYIRKPTNIDGSHDPELCDYANQLTIAIATWLAWAIDRQFDRVNSVAQEIAIIHGVKLQQ